MLVQDYPVTQGYGLDPDYPLNGGFHRGIDYGCPNGTPLIVNGVTIALTNNTGGSTGPHCHVGKFVDGVVQDPGVGNGFNFNTAIVYDSGSDTLNGNYIRLTADGALWVYLHLQKVIAVKGQILRGVSDMSTVGEVEFHDLFEAFFGPMSLNAPTEGDRKRWIGSETNTVIRQMQDDPRTGAYNQYVKDLEKAQRAEQPAKFKPYDGKTLYEEI